jgi:hypothetical protein
MTRRIADADDFWAMGEVQPDGCILWTGNVDPNGYGRMSPT